ncbi:MAG TPA: SDR family NAD(P)-dependent oxidoreductase [Planctomycetota bacterium]|nr:SDR family NAD(P)-dependent oxidoreductase [Planctomycetota bacterium]
MTDPAAPGRPLAVVTGASSGIGAAFAELLAARGCDLRVVARREDRLAALCAKLARERGVSATYDVADLATEEGLDRWIASVRAGGRTPAWLVNNAGFGAAASTLDVPLDRLRRMLRLNVEAVLVASRELGGDMAKEGGGVIVNVASTAAFQPLPWFGAYAATKAFVLHFSEALHVELRGRVRVVALCPGYTATEFEGTSNLGGRFDRFPRMSAFDVARGALAAADRGAALHVPGLMNKIQTFLSMKAPRTLVRAAATRLFRV